MNVPKHMCQAGGQRAKYGRRSLNFKPQPAYFLRAVVVYRPTCLEKQTMFLAML